MPPNNWRTQKMTVKNIEKNGNQATIVVEIDKELMESGVQKAYLKARKNIQIPGFRKGKAPRVLIEKMYGAHVSMKTAWKKSSLKYTRRQLSSRI